MMNEATVAEKRPVCQSYARQSAGIAREDSRTNEQRRGSLPCHPSNSPTTPCQISPPARGIPRTACRRSHRNSPLRHLNGRNQEVHLWPKEWEVEGMAEAVETVETGQDGGQNREGDWGPSRGHKWSMSAREKLALHHGAFRC